MSKKIRLGILFGGRSCEHEVSLTSARSVLEALDRDKYEVTLIGISRQGRWLQAGEASRVLEAGILDEAGLPAVALDHAGGRALVCRNPGVSTRPLDVIFPILHGPYGEDGTVQGLMELADLAYVGSGVVGSAVGMDKEMMRRVFRAEGLPQVDYTVVRRPRWRCEPGVVQREVEARFSYPFFIKPASLGSSVGVSKVHSSAEFPHGMDEAAAFDFKIMIEAEARNCREIECAILGNEDPRASVLGEIVPGSEFYDYEAKYIDDSSRLIIPARLPEETAHKVREMALSAFRAVEAAGLARVDFFVERDSERLYLNEINTLPGFTPISMYPRLWAASGVSYGELIDCLIALALERQGEKQRTRTRL